MTFEFTATVSADGQIRLPSDIAGQIPSGKELHVVLTWEALADSNQSYQALGRSLRAASPYAPAEEETFYDSLA